MSSASAQADSQPQASSSTTPPLSSSSLEAPMTDAELEKLLSREASAFQRDLEVERILKAFKLNPYDILDLDETASAEQVKKKYRQISLFIHPDKCAHERAPEAFDTLKKAESELSDKAKREQVDGIVSQARAQILKSLSLPTNTAPDDIRMKQAGLTPAVFKERLRLESKQLLIDEEFRRRKAIKMNLANEGLEARKKEEEVAGRKRKAEEDKQWEENRDGRVDSWRNFANSSKKKKKAKVAVLG